MGPVDSGVIAVSFAPRRKPRMTTKGDSSTLNWAYDVDIINNVCRLHVVLSTVESPLSRAIDSQARNRKPKIVKWNGYRAATNGRSVKKAKG